MKRTRRYFDGSVPPSRKWSGVSARRGEQERLRQEQLRREYGGNWFLEHRAARLEREAAEAREGGRGDGPSEGAH